MYDIPKITATKASAIRPRIVGLLSAYETPSRMSLPMPFLEVPLGCVPALSRHMAATDRT